eukprot:scaffold174968_cov58-Attheya_sp.AAC.1
MHTKGTKVLFETRVPTKHELETYEHIEMTSPKPWEPSQELREQSRPYKESQHNDEERDPQYCRLLRGIEHIEDSKSNA